MHADAVYKIVPSRQREHNITRIRTTELHFIQMRTLSMWIFGLLLISLSGADGLTSFPDNLVVAKKDDANPVTLTCGMNSGGHVTWKFEEDGKVEDMDLGENVQQNGQNLVLREVDVPMVGEYSCWSGGEKLSSVYLLLDAEEEEEDLASLISCRANSYDCNFNCSWTGRGYTAVHLGLGHECSKGQKSCQWVNSSDELLDGRFQFEMSHFLSPYAEESTMLEVTAEAISDYSFLRTTKRFYLRNIVQPDSPQIVRCQEVGQDLNVSINPPASWSTPHSFFSLEHEIEYVYKDDGRPETSLSTLIPKRISKLRVRSRDPLVPSAWSHWTPWKNVVTGNKKLCKCKNTAKYCCTKWSSEKMKRCATKQRKKAKSNTN